MSSLPHVTTNAAMFEKSQDRRRLGKDLVHSTQPEGRTRARATRNPRSLVLQHPPRYCTAPVSCSGAPCLFAHGSEACSGTGPCSTTAACLASTILRRGTTYSRRHQRRVRTLTRSSEFAPCGRPFVRSFVRSCERKAMGKVPRPWSKKTTPAGGRQKIPQRRNR